MYRKRLLAVATTVGLVLTASPTAQSAEPVYEAQSSRTNALFSLRGPDLGGAVPFVTDDGTLDTFAAWVVSGSRTGVVRASIRTVVDDPSTEIAADSVDIGAQGGTGQGWLEFNFDGVAADPSTKYFAVLQAQGWESGTNIAWHGNRALVPGALKSWSYDKAYWGGWQEYGSGAAARFANYNLAFYVNDALNPGGCRASNSCWRHVPAEQLAVNPAGLLGTPGNPYALSAFQVVGAHYVRGSSVLVLPGGEWFYLPEGATEPVVVPAGDPDAQAQIDESRRWLAAGTVPGDTDAEREMAERALLDMRLLLQPNGAVAAAWHGAWKYSWPRDSTFTSVAFARTGHHEEAYRILKFNASTLRLDCSDRPTNCEVGTWDARTYLDGSGPPDSRIWQLDGNGWVPWALWQYLQVATPKERKQALSELYPTIKVAADYAAASLDENGLPPASPDYWEISTTAPNIGTAAPLLAGLRAAANIAEMKRDSASAAHWYDAADRLQSGIDATFRENGYQRTVIDGSGIDSAITFMAPPFNPADSAMWDSIDHAWDVLVEPTGGVKPGEFWKGAETWTPETMFFALAWANGGDSARAASLVDWMDAHRTVIGAFPEKITPSGSPAAVSTLGWTASLTLMTMASLDEPMPVAPIRPWRPGDGKPPWAASHRG